MVSTFTPNIQLEEPARGDDVGTWDTPVNNNMTLIDLVTGGTVVIGLGSGNVTLSAAQFKSNTIIFNSTLVQNTTVTFPTSFQKPYNILHNCTGSSAFTITLATTAGAATFVAIPPGTMCSVLNFNSNITFAQLGMEIGGYWDYAGSSVPNWVSACAIPPYILCNGSGFSSATYPLLTQILGSAVAPDSGGRVRATLNLGTGRLTAGGGGVDGNTRGAAGGVETVALVTANLPPYTPTQSGEGTLNLGIPLQGGIYAGGQSGAGSATPTCAQGNNQLAQTTLNVANFTGTITMNAQGGTSTPFTNVQPTYIGGIVMIRAA